MIVISVTLLLKMKPMATKKLIFIDFGWGSDVRYADDINVLRIVEGLVFRNSSCKDCTYILDKYFNELRALFKGNVYKQITRYTSQTRFENLIHALFWNSVVPQRFIPRRNRALQDVNQALDPNHRPVVALVNLAPLQDNNNSNRQPNIRAPSNQSNIIAPSNHNNRPSTRTQHNVNRSQQRRELAVQMRRAALLPPRPLPQQPQRQPSQQRQQQPQPQQQEPTLRQVQHMLQNVVESSSRLLNDNNQQQQQQQQQQLQSQLHQQQQKQLQLQLQQQQQQQLQQQQLQQQKQGQERFEIQYLVQRIVDESSCVGETYQVIDGTCGKDICILNNRITNTTCAIKVTELSGDRNHLWMNESRLHQLYYREFQNVDNAPSCQVFIRKKQTTYGIMLLYPMHSTLEVYLKSIHQITPQISYTLDSIVQELLAMVEKMRLHTMCYGHFHPFQKDLNKMDFVPHQVA